MKRRVVLTRPAYARHETARRVIAPPLPRVEKERSKEKEGSGDRGVSKETPPDPTSHFVVSKKEQRLANVLDLAEQLTAEQRKELLDRLALRNSITSEAANNRDLDMWAQAIAIALREEIAGGDGGNYGVLLLKRTLGSPVCWRPVENFMERSGLANFSVIERQSIYLLLARLLVEHAAYVARKSGAPLSAKLVGSCVPNLPGVVDQAFPGYLAAGLMPMVARQIHAGHANR